MAARKQKLYISRLGSLADTIYRAAKKQADFIDFGFTIEECIDSETRFHDIRVVAKILMSPENRKQGLAWALDNCERRDCARNRQGVPRTRRRPKYVL